jgi:hypothetical protein
MTTCLRASLAASMLIALSCVPLLSLADAGGESGAAPTLTVPLLPAAPPLDATLDGSWSAAAVVHLTYEATYHRPAPEDTTIRIGRYGSALYVAFEAQQREPMVASQVTDGPGVLTGDAVMVHIWPNGLNGFAYWYATNPFGARDQFSSENSGYAPPWLAFGHRTIHGYVAILKIPLSAMHVQKNATWRMQFHRMVVASSSNYVWELASEQASFVDARYAGHVVGLDETQATALHPRLQLYGLGEVASSAVGGSTSHVGADFSLPVTATASLFGTLHPDFSNVEIDQQSISPTEFARRFSEVRPFFAQAASNFGQQASVNAPMSVLYTPTIPTFSDGFGAEGRQGTISFGIFNAHGDGRDDDALALFASDPHQELTVGAQRVGVDTTSTDASGFRDLVDEESIALFNPHGHLTSFANIASEKGTSVTAPGDAEYSDVGENFQTSTAQVAVALQKMGPQFAPADGYSNQPPGEPGIAGFTSFASKQINFSQTARVLDVAFSVNADRYHSPDGNVNQSDFADSARVDFKDLITLMGMQGVSSLQTCVPLSPSTCSQEFLPYNNGGYMAQYAANTSHPSTIMYLTGEYFHGRLDSWTRSFALPLAQRATLVLEADDTTYVSALAGEPDTKQWLDRASLNFQFNRSLSVDLGARRILGTTQPYAFAPLGLTSAFTASVCRGNVNVFYPITAGCTASDDATNLSAAFHFFRGQNELYVVYGNPSRLSTVPALYVKFIRYIGAGKGS